MRRASATLPAHGIYNLINNSNQLGGLRRCCCGAGALLIVPRHGVLNRKVCLRIAISHDDAQQFKNECVTLAGIHIIYRFASQTIFFVNSR